MSWCTYTMVTLGCCPYSQNTALLYIHLNSMPCIAWGSQLYSYCPLYVTADLDSNKHSTAMYTYFYITFEQHRLANVQHIAIVHTNTSLVKHKQLHVHSLASHCISNCSDQLCKSCDWKHTLNCILKLLMYTSYSSLKTTFMYTFLSSLFIHQFIKCSFANMFYSYYDKTLVKRLVENPWQPLDFMNGFGHLNIQKKRKWLASCVTWLLS